jgi:hypothetical protein
MARRKKPEQPEEPYTPFSEIDRRGRVTKRDVEPKYTREVIRDAFLEGKDELAVIMLREMDGRADIKAARKAILAAEDASKNMPPNCMGAIPKLATAYANLEVASERLRGIPHEMRAPNSILFGKLNRTSKKLWNIVQYAAQACTGSIADRPLDLDGLSSPRRRKRR